jgi:transcriptional regulator with XRE-family HTH domain
MTLGDARKLLGWTQTRLAREAGESISTISDLENGRNKKPSYVVVTHIVRALQRGGLQGVAADDIFPVTEAKAS